MSDERCPRRIAVCQHLPERVYVHTDAYAERIGVSLKPLPAGPRLMGEEAEYVRADLHEGAVDEAVTERRPRRIAVCQHPNGDGVWWDADKHGPSCLQECDCTPVLYVRDDPTREQWTITICDGCRRQVGVIGHAGRCNPATESDVVVVAREQP